MRLTPLEIAGGRKLRPKLSQSLKFVIVGLLIMAIGIPFMDIRLYFPYRDKLEHLEGKALSLKPSSLVAMKEKLSSSSSGATPQSGGYSKLNDSDRIFENFPITEMQLPTLFNLILSPHGEEALQLGVPSPPTLLYDLSLSNISSSPVWDTTKSPPDPLDPKEGKSVNPLSATKSDEDSPSKEQDTVNDEMKIGRKLRFWKS